MKTTLSLIFIFIIKLPVFCQVSFQKNLPSYGDNNFAQAAYELSDHTFFIRTFSQNSIPPPIGLPCDLENGIGLTHVDSDGTTLNILSNQGYFNNFIVGNDKYFDTWADLQNNYYVSGFNSAGDTLFRTILNDTLIYSFNCVSAIGNLYAIAQKLLAGSNFIESHLFSWDASGNLMSQSFLYSDSVRSSSHYIIPSEDGGIVLIRKIYNTPLHNQYGIVDSVIYVKKDSLGNTLVEKTGDPGFQIGIRKGNGYYLFKEDNLHQKTIYNLDENLDTIFTQHFTDTIHWERFSSIHGNKWAYIFKNTNNEFDIGIIDSAGTITMNESIKYPLPNSGPSEVGFICELSDRSLLYGGHHNVYPSSNLCVSYNSTAFISRTDSIFSLIGIDELSHIADASIFPNPFTTTATVEIRASNISIIEIFDVSGKIIKSQKLFDQFSEIDRQNISNGIYFYRIMNNDLILHRGKLVIQ